MSEVRSTIVMEAQIKSTADQVDDISRTVNRIDNALRGNGSTGLFTEFAVLTNRVDRIEEFTTELIRLRRVLTTGVIAFLGTLVWSAVHWAIKTGG